jgi:hypothetical protein
MSDPTRFTIPPAQEQTSLPPEDLLTSANAGVIVERTAQLRNGFHAEGRQFARGLAELINVKQQGTATVFVYEETFGTKDKMHFLIHLSSLAAYEVLVAMGTKDEEYRAQLSPDQKAEAARWDKIFVDGGMHETVLLPQFWGMYGTKADGKLERESTVYTRPAPVAGIPGAREQVALPIDQILHTGNAGIVMHRTALLEYDFRSEGRVFAREVAQSINENLPGEVTVFVFEEAFGTADRLHWLIQLKSITSYYRLLELHVRNEKVRDLYFEQKIPAERGGGTWARMFVPGSMVDVALTPQHWGMYGT